MLSLMMFPISRLHYITLFLLPLTDAFFIVSYILRLYYTFAFIDYVALPDTTPRHIASHTAILYATPF